MKALWIIGFAGLGASVAVANPGAFRNLFEVAYPRDAAMRQALTDCFLSDFHFDRFDAAQRDACYRHRLPTIEPAAAVPTGHLAPKDENPINLKQAASAGSMPQNDIRFEQQTERFTHPNGTQGR
jgi:hypothetical protein